MRRLSTVLLVALLAAPWRAQRPGTRPAGRGSAHSENRRQHLRGAALRARAEAGRLRHPQHAVGHRPRQRAASVPRVSGSSTSSRVRVRGCRSASTRTSSRARVASPATSICGTSSRCCPARAPRRIYITAHYDTVNIGEEGQISANTRAPSNTPRPDPQLRRNQDYNVDAPGANDNGSGTALTMELARVFAESGVEFDATLAFVLWAGEEQGLIGARAHAMELFKDKVSRRRQLQQRHRRQLAWRRRHDRCRVGPRVFGRAGGLDVAVAGALHRAVSGRVCAVTHGPPRWPGRIGSAAAATIRRSPSTAFPPSRSANRRKISPSSMRPPTRLTESMFDTSHRTRA